MNRHAFLRELEGRLAALSEAERDQTLAYYGEMIDDRIEAGMSEEAAVAALGAMEEIAAEALQGAPQLRSLRRAPGVWSILIGVLGSPLWLPLVATGFLLALIGYALLWVLTAVLYVCAASFAVGALGALISLFAALVRVRFIWSGMCLGLACLLAGGSILLLLAANRAAAGCVRLGTLGCRRIRKLFRRKEL